MHTSGMANESEQKHSDAVNSDKSNDLEGSQKSQIGALNVQHRVSGPEASTLNETKVTKTEPSKGQNSPNNQFPQSVAAADAANTDRDTDLVDDDDAATNMQMDTGGGKKKNKRKPKSQRGKNAPTGFEEYYVDAPLTAGEYEEEKQIYHPSYRFEQRIETAIQRFIAKRRFTSVFKHLFDKYLMHGGIEAGPKMFGGLDPDALKTKNAAEIAEMAATHYVDSNKVDAIDSIHVVDFEGCLKSFLSGEILDQWETDSEEQIQNLVRILRNFLNYLLHHDVCPEYKDQVYAARDFCDIAAKELWNVKRLSSLLPGEFNISCSEIFGGTYQGMHAENASWMGDEMSDSRLGISPQRARDVFKIGIAAHANDELFLQYRKQLTKKTCHLVGTEEINLEITDIIHANDTILSLYSQPANSNLKVLGRMKAKTWFIPYPPDEDLTEDEEAHLKANPPKIKEYEFWIEEEILEKCAIGTKLKADIKKTSFGLTYLDAIGGVFCSFYQIIPNQLMEDWREIENEWLPMKYNRYTAAAKEAREAQDHGVNNNEELEEAQQALEETTIETKEGGINVGDSEKDETAEQPEGEPDNFMVNHNIVAAGYDEDFEDGADKAGPDQNDGTSDGLATAQFGVQVQKVGEELKEVPGNTDKVMQGNFEVKRIEEVE